MNFKAIGGCFFVAIFLSGVPAVASGLSYTCATGTGQFTPAQCTTINSTLQGLYGGVFTNANAQIYVQFGSTGLGESQQFYNSVSYNNYYSALVSHSSGDATDTSALASLSSTEPTIFGAGSIYLTTALEAALGLGTGVGTDTSLNSCTPDPASPNPTCFDGVITISNSFTYYYRTGGANTNGYYDFYNVLEHETDEILGTPSCIVDIASAPHDGCNSTGASPADLFRYSGSGQRAFVNQGTSSYTAYFSVNGGQTAIANYNNQPNGGDYGDWSTSCTHVQDAYGCQGVSLDITSNGGAEVKVLDAVGYTLAPEPATWMLMALSIAVIAMRRQKLISPAAVKVGLSRRRSRR